MSETVSSEVPVHRLQPFRIISGIQHFDYPKLLAVLNVIYRSSLPLATGTVQLVLFEI